jgi:hypothetical protein
MPTAKKPSRLMQAHHTASVISEKQLKRPQEGKVESSPSDYPRFVNPQVAKKLQVNRDKLEALKLAAEMRKLDDPY